MYDSRFSVVENLLKIVDVKGSSLFVLSPASFSIGHLESARVEALQLYETNGRANKQTAIKYIETHYSRYRHDCEFLSSFLTPSASILDLGAAPFLVPLALSRQGHQVTAVDFRPDDWLTGNLPFDLIQADCDGTALPFESGSFDAVLLTEVFEHLHVNLNYTMKEILRVLKVDGFLYLSTPNLLGARGTFRLLRQGAMRQSIHSCWQGAEAGGYLGHVREYTPREIREYLKDCGYSSIHVDTVNVYKKDRFETWIWSAITLPFKDGKENIRAIAYKR